MHALWRWCILVSLHATRPFRVDVDGDAHHGHTWPRAYVGPTSRPPTRVSSARGPVLMGAPLHILRVWQWGDTEVVLRALGAARVGCGTYRCAGGLTPGWAGPQVGRQCAGRSARGSVCPDALTLTPSTDHRPRKSSLVAPGAVQVPRRERERVSCLRFLFPFLF